MLKAIEMGYFIFKPRTAAVGFLRNRSKIPVKSLCNFGPWKCLRTGGSMENDASLCLALLQGSAANTTFSEGSSLRGLFADITLHEALVDVVDVGFPDFLILQQPLFSVK